MNTAEIEAHFEVGDNGRSGTLIEGAGLSGMRERIESPGGSMEIDSTSGTSIRVRVPILAGPRDVADGPGHKSS